MVAAIFTITWFQRTNELTAVMAAGISKARIVRPLVAATVIVAASHFGMPVSTTHVISGAIMGVGSSDRFNAVRWAVARNIGVAWVLTIPAAALVAAIKAEGYSARAL